MGLFSNLKKSIVSSVLDDSAQLYYISEAGIRELSWAYKSLSKKGKFEVILCNSITALGAYHRNHPDFFEETRKGLYQYIINESVSFKLGFNFEQLSAFIINRIDFYSRELDNISNKQDYVPGKIYSAFYLNPLEAEPEMYLDLIEMLKFFKGLQSMRKSVHSSASKL